MSKYNSLPGSTPEDQNAAGTADHAKELEEAAKTAAGEPTPDAGDVWLSDDFIEEYATPESMQQQGSGISEEKYENWTEQSSDEAMDAWIQGSVPKHLLQILDYVMQPNPVLTKNSLMVERHNFELAYGSPGYSDYNMPAWAPDDVKKMHNTSLQMDPLRRRLGKYWSNPKDMATGIPNAFPDNEYTPGLLSYFDWPFIFRSEVSPAGSPDKLSIKTYGLRTKEGTIEENAVHVRRGLEDLNEVSFSDFNESLLAWKNNKSAGTPAWEQWPGGKHFRTYEVVEGFELRINLKEHPEFNNTRQINTWLRSSKNAAYSLKDHSMTELAELHGGIQSADFLDSEYTGNEDQYYAPPGFVVPNPNDDINSYPALAGTMGPGYLEQPIATTDIQSYFVAGGQGPVMGVGALADAGAYIVSVGIESDYPWNKPQGETENINPSTADQLPLIAPSSFSLSVDYLQSEFYIVSTGELSQPPPPSELRIQLDGATAGFTQGNWDIADKIPGTRGGYLVQWTPYEASGFILAEFVPAIPGNILGSLPDAMVVDQLNIERQQNPSGIFFDHTFRYNSAITDKFSNGHYVKYIVNTPTWDDQSKPAPESTVHKGEFIGGMASTVGRVTPEYNYFLKGYEEGIKNFGDQAVLGPGGARFETALPNPYTRRWIYGDAADPLGTPLPYRPEPGFPLLDSNSAYLYKFTTLALAPIYHTNPVVLEPVLSEDISNTVGGSAGTEYFSAWPPCYNRAKDLSEPYNFFERKMQNIFFDSKEFDKTQLVVENQPAGKKPIGGFFGELVYENTPPELAKKEYYPMGVTVEIPLEQEKTAFLPDGETIKLPPILGGGSVSTPGPSSFSSLLNKHNLIVPLMKWVSGQQNHGHNYKKMDDYNASQAGIYTSELPEEWGTDFAGGGHTGPQRTSPGFMGAIAGGILGGYSVGFIGDENFHKYVQVSKTFRSYTVFPFMLPEEIVNANAAAGLNEQFPPTLAGRADIDGNGYKIYDFVSWFDALMDADVEAVDQGGDLKGVSFGPTDRPYTVLSSAGPNNVSAWSEVYNNKEANMAIQNFLAEFYNDSIELIEANNLTRSVKRIFDKEEAYSETLFYAIKKWDINGQKLEQCDEQGPGKLLQTIYVPNFDDKAVFKYFDSQVKYGKRYKYEIYAYKMVVGTEYRYSHVGPVIPQGTAYGGPENDGKVYTNCKKYVAPEEFWPSAEEAVVWLVCDDGPDDNSFVYSNEYEYADIYFETKCSPSLKIVEVPYFSATPDDEYAGYTSVVDDPPLAPDVNILPFSGINNQLMFNLNMNSGQVFQKPIKILPDEMYEHFYESQGYPFGTVVRFTHESDLVGYRIYKTDKKPSSYSDFLQGAYKDLKASDGGSYIDKNICPNKKFYYTFKAYDKHGHFSNPTYVYEVELVDDDGAVYPVMNIFEPKYQMPHSKQKDMKKYVYVGIATGHKLIGQGSTKYHKKYLENSDSDLNEKILQTIGEAKKYSVYGKSFKIRFKSKKSGKMFDINIYIDKDGKVFREGTFGPGCDTEVEFPTQPPSGLAGMEDGWYEKGAEVTKEAKMVYLTEAEQEAADNAGQAEGSPESMGAIPGPGQKLFETEEEDEDDDDGSGGSGGSGGTYNIFG
jgi:hypothetical protein